jgi:hypothetical protein
VAGCGGPCRSGELCGKHAAARRRDTETRPCSIAGCTGRLVAKGYCVKHYQRFTTHGDPLKILTAEQGSGSITTRGYRTHFRHDHPNAAKCGAIMEHRLVMSESLGRPLLPHETVHHKNGDRLDNRLVKGHESHCPGTCCNLELWSKSQPYGQRVADKLAWAREILATYETATLP